MSNELKIKGISNLKKTISEKNIFIRALFLALEIFMSTAGITLLFGLILGIINQASERLMYQSIGWSGILITGFIGTPVHEFGHYIMCKLFGIRVLEVSWFRPIAAKSDGQLGYVLFNIEKGNRWQQLGCFFVGIAPLIVGTFIIILLFRIMLPEAFKKVYSELTESIKKDDFSIISSYKLVLNTIKIILIQPKNIKGRNMIIRYILFIVLIFSISSHIKLSMSDLNGAMFGIGLIVLLIYVIALVVEALKKNIKKWLVKTSAVLCAFFNLAVVFSLFSLIISNIMFLLFG